MCLNSLSDKHSPYHLYSGLIINSKNGVVAPASRMITNCISEEAPKNDNKEKQINKAEREEMDLDA